MNIVNKWNREKSKSRVNKLHKWTCRTGLNTKNPLFLYVFCPVQDVHAQTYFLINREVNSLIDTNKSKIYKYIGAVREHSEQGRKSPIPIYAFCCSHGRKFE